MSGVILLHYQDRISEAKSLKELKVIEEQIDYHFSRLSAAMKQIPFFNQQGRSHERIRIHHP